MLYGTRGDGSVGKVVATPVRGLECSLQNTYKNLNSSMCAFNPSAGIVAHWPAGLPETANSRFKNKVEPGDVAHAFNPST